MRKYETFFILDPDLSDEANAAVDEKLKTVVSSNGGTLLSYASWGKKKLAYPVKKRIRGHYVLMEYAGGPKLVAELERNMRLDERLLKFITVKLEERFDPEKEEARRGAAQAAAETEEVTPEKESFPVVEQEEEQLSAMDEDVDASEEEDES
ncbi:MAG: 30S ribosomal protein S6 [Deltaproteobacteria bacterium]|nr:30S ribosomal protein S6 [Deltaproteobacteria bacterium]